MGGVKDVWNGVFNLNHTVYVEYAHAYTERQAWFIICNRIARKKGVHPKMVMNYFGGKKDNYKIRKEIEFKQEEA